MALWSNKLEMPSPDRALPGRDVAMPVPAAHEVLGTSMTPPFPEGSEQFVVGMGCFWGAERVFWQAPGVITTAVGYGAGVTPNPSYEEVCSGLTGHTEVVMVWFHPEQCSFAELLRTFWERHDPTQGMRQGNDIGTQYRSAIFTQTDAQLTEALASADAFGTPLKGAGFPEVTTEIRKDSVLYFAEGYHQQYLHKNPNGYCGLRGTGVSCSI